MADVSTIRFVNKSPHEKKNGRIVNNEGDG